MSGLSSRTVITTIGNDGELHVIKPNASTGGYDSYRITKLNFLKELQAEVDAIGISTMINLTEVANNTTRDALSPDVGNYVVVTTNDNGQRVMNRYIYDNNTSTNTWVEIGLLPNIM